MKKILLLSVTWLFLFCACGKSQKIRTEYFDDKGSLTKKKEASSYRVIETLEASKEYKVTGYFKDGELMMTGKYSSIRPDVMDGEFNFYNKAGRRIAQKFFKAGILLSENIWDENGNLKPPVEKAADRFPEYPGGMQELYKFIGANYTFPKDFKTKPSGVIKVRFTVEGDGSVQDVAILEGLDPELDEEAIRVIKGMPDWIPGIQNGKYVRVAMTVPINLKH